MTEQELSKYLNNLAEIKLQNGNLLLGVVLKASEFEREDSSYIFIRRGNLIEWNTGKEKKDRERMLNLQIDIDIDNIMSITIINN